MKISRRQLRKIIMETVKGIPPKKDEEWSHTDFRDGWGPNDAENWERQSRYMYDYEDEDTEDESTEEYSEEDEEQLTLQRAAAMRAEEEDQTFPPWKGSGGWE